MKKIIITVPSILLLGFVVLIGAIGASIYNSFTILKGFELNSGSTSFATYTEESLVPDVEAYRSTVTEVAKIYGMEEYVDLILAVMMQESHGESNNVMQVNGCENATVNESINQGICELKNDLTLAGVVSPSDIKNIKIALQGYNFGSGYIRWVQKNDKKWTQDNALEFQKKQANGKTRSGKEAENLGPYKYGDAYYVPHVLQYYPYDENGFNGIINEVNSLTSNVAIVNEAQKHIGKKYVWGAKGPDQFDCSGFVYYCYKSCGYNISMSTADGYSKQCTIITKDQLQPGDLIFYKRNSENTYHHVAIYVGNGSIIHAKGKKYGVVQESYTYQEGSQTLTYGRLNFN